jgi:hypothetical protein
MSPEASMGRDQLRHRRNEHTLEGLARTYDRQAQGALAGSDGVVARDEISRFAKRMSSALETERDDLLDNLMHAIRLRRGAFFDEVPEEQRERRAFALALVKQYELEKQYKKSLQ